MKSILPPMSQRQKCVTKGCTNKRQVVGRNKDNHATFRSVCGKCHIKLCAIKKGLTETGWLNSFHPYRKWRKDFCENRDGRLGFVCTTNVIWDGMLDTDHMDGNPTNHSKENMQTLCACCHRYKGTVLNKDYASPGRKALKSVAKKQQSVDI